MFYYSNQSPIIQQQQKTFLISLSFDFLSEDDSSDQFPACIDNSPLYLKTRQCIGTKGNPYIGSQLKEVLPNPMDALGENEEKNEE